MSFSFIFLSSNIQNSYSAYDENILYWHYNDAKWWSEGKITDEKYQKSLFILLNDSNKKLSNTSEEYDIPFWFTNVAKWFSENQISHNEYLTVINFLYSENIIKISNSSSNLALLDYSSEKISLIQTFEKNVDLFSASLFNKDISDQIDGVTQYHDVQFQFNSQNIEKYDSLINSSNSVVVVPTFTFTAYTEPGFYTFYHGECDQEFH